MKAAIALPLLVLSLAALAGCRTLTGPVSDELYGEDQDVSQEYHPTDVAKPPVPPVPPPRVRPETPAAGVNRIPARPAHVHGNLDVALARDWKYIVIHHSAGPSGNAEIFDRAHKARGWEGVGYDFVIGNGHGLADGDVEVTFRWEQQIQGAHAGVYEFNQRGIGICLVGDFNASVPTARQMDSLVSLIHYLQGRTQIPTSNIRGHRDVKSTDCPGRNFPWYEMLALLAE